MQISCIEDINGTEYQIIINHSPSNSSSVTTEGPESKSKGPPPIQVYITKKAEIVIFGGYVYSIPYKNQVIQSVIKNGNNLDKCKSFGNLIALKKGVNYVNLNMIDEFDYQILIKKVMDLLDNDTTHV